MDDREEQMQRGRKLGFGFVDLSRLQVSQKTIDSVPAKLAHLWRFLPLKLEGRLLFVAVDKPVDRTWIDGLSAETEYKVIPMLACATPLLEAIDKYYPPG